MPVTKEYWAKRKRIQRLPTIGQDFLRSYAKKDALNFVRHFHDGIKENSMSLHPLKDGTIKRKIRQSFQSPETPLYGAGDERKDRSYMNLWRIRKLKSGWKCTPSLNNHWNAKITLKKLYEIHEYGAIVKRNGALIRIPARPAGQIAYKLMLMERDAAETSKEVKTAITDHINKGRGLQVSKQTQRFLNAWKKYDMGQN